MLFMTMDCVSDNWAYSNRTNKCASSANVNLLWLKKLWKCKACISSASYSGISLWWYFSKLLIDNQEYQTTNNSNLNTKFPVYSPVLEVYILQNWNRKPTVLLIPAYAGLLTQLKVFTVD